MQSYLTMQYDIHSPEVSLTSLVIPCDCLIMTQFFVYMTRNLQTNTNLPLATDGKPSVIDYIGLHTSVIYFVASRSLQKFSTGTNDPLKGKLFTNLCIMTFDILSYASFYNRQRFSFDTSIKMLLSKVVRDEAKTCLRYLKFCLFCVIHTSFPFVQHSCQG